MEAIFKQIRGGFLGKNQRPFLKIKKYEIKKGQLFYK
jgi:hypothetical protein